MLKATLTENYTGIALRGDHNDFNRLYDALWNIVGYEEEISKGVESAKFRILGLCYDLRHAMQGDREIVFEDNGMEPDTLKYRNVIAPEKNLYLEIRTLMPEILFIIAVLEKFIGDFTDQINKKYSPGRLYENPRVSWSKDIAITRLFQSIVMECLEAELSPNRFSRLRKSLHNNYIYPGSYMTQYVDILNDRYYYLSKEKRLDSISIYAKHLGDWNEEYKNLYDNLIKEAKKKECSPHDLRLKIDYPDEVIW